MKVIEDLIIPNEVDSPVPHILPNGPIVYLIDGIMHHYGDYRLEVHGNLDIYQNSKNKQEKERKERYAKMFLKKQKIKGEANGPKYKNYYSSYSNRTNWWSG